jgi:hypothetical protein
VCVEALIPIYNTPQPPTGRGMPPSSPPLDLFLLSIPFKLIRIHKNNIFNDVHNNNQQACIF